MERSVRFSTILFAVVLSPALWQTSVTCNSRNAELASLELCAGGLDGPQRGSSTSCASHSDRISWAPRSSFSATLEV